MAERIIEWELPSLGLGAAAEGALVGECLASAGRRLSTQQLLVLTGHAFRISARAADELDWRALFEFAPERDPWAVAGAVADADVEPLRLSPDDAWAVVDEEVAAERPVVLGAEPGQRPAGLLLGARSGGEVRVAVPALRAVSPDETATTLAWLPLAELGEEISLIRVRPRGPAPRDPLCAAQLLDVTRWAHAHLVGPEEDADDEDAADEDEAAPDPEAPATGLEAYQELAQVVVVQRSEAAALEVDPFYATVIDDLYRSRCAAAAGLEAFAAAFDRADLEGNARTLNEVAAAYRGTLPGILTMRELLRPARWYGREDAVVALTDSKSAAYAKDAVSESGAFEVLAAEALAQATLYLE